MDTIIYYSEMEGISLEHLKRSSGYDMRSNHFHNEYEIYFSQKESASFSSTTVPIR